MRVRVHRPEHLLNKRSQRRVLIKINKTFENQQTGIETINNPPVVQTNRSNFELVQESMVSSEIQEQAIQRLKG